MRLTDTAGAPLANAQVKIDQKTHRFLFGCNAFNAVPATDPALSDDLKPLFADRVEKWLKLFNYGTLPFYWGGFEETEGNPQTESRMRAADFLLSHGVKLKGHPLCWHTVCAPWLLQYDNKTIMEKQLARIRRDVAAFKGKIDMWDVINEVVIMPVFDKYDNAITRICNEYGQVPLVKAVFDEARATNNGATLLLNDFNTSQQYADLIARCLDAGVCIDVIGIQSHQHQGFWGEEKLEEVLARFEKFNLPIHFTENTFVSGHIMPADIVDLNDYQIPDWPTTPEGEERQKNDMLKLYTRLFEHPLVEGITWWDFCDGEWLGAPSGFLRKDGTCKPLYHALDNLIHNEWHTAYEAKTDDGGFVTVEGFKGEYDVTVCKTGAVTRVSVE